MGVGMPIFFTRSAALLTLLVLLAGLNPMSRAGAQEHLGLVLLHGKGGMPQQLTPMASAL
jgi:hypothetical protein